MLEEKCPGTKQKVYKKVQRLCLLQTHTMQLVDKMYTREVKGKGTVG